MPREITVTIADGKAKVQTEGFVGRECMDATAALQKALGVTESDDPTPEMTAQVPRTVGN